MEEKPQRWSNVTRGELKTTAQTLLGSEANQVEDP